ncbi:cell division protein FtsB [Luteimonas aquatica]|uniref:cell division protein FtsB n=1 Tax=Luteimonas aquatica TaxID=450364 RepID=UPI001F561147|nr:cell division protein FtsB [Luteimonas aquatica]
MRVLSIVALLLVLLLAWLQYRLWVGHGGAGDVAELQQQVLEQERANSGLRQRNDALAAEVKDLKSADGGAAVEERARSELGMIKPGETFYRVVERSPQSAPAQQQAPQPQEQTP